MPTWPLAPMDEFGDTRMFDLGEKANITVKGEDGTIYEMGGYVTRMNITSDHGQPCGAEVSFVSSGPPVVSDVVSIPVTYTPDVSIGTLERIILDDIKGPPHMLYGDDYPRTPWSNDALFLWGLLWSLPIIYAGVKLGMWVLN
ncbi:MAG: hypothetical protein O7D91_17730 [Planctomycetota bacterium]|nr:hypothetical protein [Planctomycetota bacterium]